MRISFERSGGIVGRRMTAAIDSATLDRHEAEELEGMVAAARFFEQPARPPEPVPGADVFLYRVTVESEGRTHTIETTDTTAVPELRPLLMWLNAAARRGSVDRGRSDS
jgi:hypothetical protein